MSEKFFKFLVYELLKFRHISKMNTQYCVAHVTTVTLLRFMSHLYTYTHLHTHKHTRAHTHMQI